MSVIKFALILVVAFVLVVLAAFAFEWFVTPLVVMSPENVERLSEQANEHYQSLQAQLATINVQRQRLKDFELLYGPDRSTWPQGKTEEYAQLLAAVRNLETAYNLSCGQYNALWQDEWKSLPAPNDLPRRCELLN